MATRIMQPCAGSWRCPPTGATPLHDLDGMFGLHPALANLKAMYDAKELIVFQNICSPYRDRSHFDGQNVLETGARQAACHQRWLAQPGADADGAWAMACMPWRWRRPRRCCSPARRAPPAGCRLAAHAGCRLPGAGQTALRPRSRFCRSRWTMRWRCRSAAMVASDDPSDKKVGPGQRRQSRRRCSPAPAGCLPPTTVPASRCSMSAAGTRMSMKARAMAQLARRLAALDAWPGCAEDRAWVRPGARPPS